MPLQITFLDDSLRELCECGVVAERALGTQAARRLRSRLADIRAARKISEVVTGRRPKPSAGRISFLLSQSHELVLEPVMKKIPTAQKAETDFDGADSFRVIEVK
jgi:hypothetical protein